MAAALNRRKHYTDSSITQGDKINSINKSKEFVEEVIKTFSPFLKVCIEYDGETKINGAPAVDLGDNKKAIAPDVYCELNDNRKFWIEVKDKPQRFFHPDTGADIFQVLGWYYISKIRKEPILVIFKDPDLNSCLPNFKVDKNLIEKFTLRWENFGGHMYGNYLSELLQISDGYPKISEERSRDLSISIFYFSIKKMIDLSINVEGLIEDLKINYDKYIVVDEIVAFSIKDNDNVNEQRIREITKESLKFNRI